MFSPLNDFYDYYKTLEPDDSKGYEDIDIIGYCLDCGRPVYYGDDRCNYCGCINLEGDNDND